jgi:ABC-2 type transport system permease protein
MLRTWSVIKREFLEMIQTRAFLIGTILGPLFMLGLIGFQIFMATRTAVSERKIIVVDQTGRGVGQAVGQGLTANGEAGRGRFTIEFVEADLAAGDAIRAELLERVGRDEVDGFLWIPAGVFSGEGVSYDGKNATSIAEMEQIRGVVQIAVQGVRLAASGIDAAEVAQALERVPFDARKTGGKAASGTTSALIGLTYILGLAIYMVVILYGAAVLRGVLEEKRDRVVEVVVSSIRADQLLAGKVLGIGGAGLFQVSIWAAFGALALSQGAAITARFGATLPELPSVPLSVGLIFLFFFTTGFLLYATLYAAIGSIATTDQEAQQLQMPVIMILVVGVSMMGPVMADPSGTAAVVGSLVPFTAPIVMPMRAVVTGIPLAELVGSMALVVLTGAALLWVSARIYRIGILTTGKRPSMREVWQWVRTG